MGSHGSEAGNDRFPPSLAVAQSRRQGQLRGMKASSRRASRTPAVGSVKGPSLERAARTKMRRFRPFVRRRLVGSNRPQAALHYGVDKWQGRGLIADLRVPLPHPIWSNRSLRARQRGATGLRHPIAERVSGCSVIAFLSECITHPGHVPRVTRPFGRHHHRVFNAQIRGGESIKPNDLAFVIVAAGPVSVGPSSEALCNAFCQRNIHWGCPFGLVGWTA